MKKILFILLFPLFFLLQPVTSKAQIDITSYSSIMNPTYGSVGQLVNIANSYFGNAPAAGARTPYVKNGYSDGPYLDTAINTTPLYLYIGQPGIPFVAVDTLIPFPITGNGTICFVLVGLNVSGTTAGKITIQQSITGLPGSWGNVEPVNTADSVTITAAGVYTFNFKDKFACYYRVAIVPTGTQKTTWQGWYYFRKPYQFGN